MTRCGNETRQVNDDLYDLIIGFGRRIGRQSSLQVTFHSSMDGASYKVASGRILDDARLVDRTHASEIDR
jgi:hypothetical protein